MLGFSKNQLSAKVRKSILARDGQHCRKCRRDENLHVHHIADHSDDPSNLTTLCVACHAEWHMAELNCNLMFEEWLPLPSYIVLLAAYRGSPPEIRAAIDTLWHMRRSINDPNFQ